MQQAKDMDTQQIITWGIGAAAAVYLGRQFVVSARGFFSAKSGCSSGCGKCGHARREHSQQNASKSSVHVINMIPLANVRTASGDKPTGTANRRIH
jgi:hypothetical protein